MDGTNHRVDDYLAHFGVKGMKWGVRRPEAKLNSSGGAGKKASDDHKNVAKNLGRASKGGTKSLSNKEIQDIVNRINLEQNYNRLTAQPTKFEKGHQRVKNILEISRTVHSVYNLATSPMAKAVGKAIAKTIKR